MDRRSLLTSCLAMVAGLLLPERVLTEGNPWPSYFASLDKWRAYLLPGLWGAFGNTSIEADLECDYENDRLLLNLGHAKCVMLTRDEITSGRWSLYCVRLREVADGIAKS